MDNYMINNLNNNISEYIKKHRVQCQHNDEYKDMINWNGSIVCMKCIGQKYEEQFRQKIIRDGFFKVGTTTYRLEELPYPHDETCSGRMCFCNDKVKKK